MLPLTIIAQQSIVSGVVFDDTENHFEATVSVKGSDKSDKISDLMANYSVNIPEGSDINFSYIGFLRQVNMSGKVQLM